jgi:hypothetical protein
MLHSDERVGKLPRRSRRMEMLKSVNPYSLRWPDDRSFGSARISPNLQPILEKVHRRPIWKYPPRYSDTRFLRARSCAIW